MTVALFKHFYPLTINTIKDHLLNTDRLAKSRGMLLFVVVSKIH